MSILIRVYISRWPKYLELRIQNDYERFPTQKATAPTLGEA